MKKCILTIVAVLVFTCAIYADDLVVKIDPAQITLNEAESCTLDVVVENVTNLGSFVFFIDYDTDIVHVDTVIIGNFLGSTGRTLFPIYTAPDNSSNPGTVEYASATIGGTQAPDGPSGTGTIAKVVFIAQGNGSTDLDLKDVELNDGTQDTNPISIDQLIDGQIDVGGGTTTPGWETQTSNVSKALRDVHVVSDQVVWIFGNSTVLRTTNGGDSWSSVGDAIDSLIFLSGYAIDANTAIANGYKSGWNKSILLRTTDGGTNWNVVYDVDGHWTTFIVMSDANNGYFYGDPVDNTWLVRKTTDGGATWNTCSITPSTNAETEYCYPSSYFWNKQNLIGFCSNSGWSYLSTDFGQTWNSVQVLDASPLTTVAYDGSNYAVIGMGYDDRMARSTDNGSSWTEITPPTGNWINSLNYFNSLFYLLIGTEIYTSSDGNSWSWETSTSVGKLNNIDYYSAADGIYAWAVGNNGTIIKYSPTGSSVEPVNVTPIPKTCILHQNSPNPFNPNTSISYSITKKTKVELRIYDVLGKCVTTLVDQIQSAGDYQINWAAQGLSSGVYFCRLTTAEGVQTIKLLYLQ